jgi:hypothetical protein
MFPIDAPGPAATEFGLNGSGLPSPAKGSGCTSRINRRTRSACARSCSTHQVRPSKAATSNSKLLNDRFEGEPRVAAGRLNKAIFHRLALQQVCRFPLLLDLAPECNGHYDCSRLAALVRNELNLCIRHALSVPSYRCTRPDPSPFNNVITSSTVNRLKSPGSECFRHEAAVANSSASCFDPNTFNP